MQLHGDVLVRVPQVEVMVAVLTTQRHVLLAAREHPVHAPAERRRILIRWALSAALALVSCVEAGAHHLVFREHHVLSRASPAFICFAFFIILFFYHSV